MITVYVSVYMKRNRLWLGDFSNKRLQKGAHERKKNCLVTKHLGGMK